MVRTTTWSMAAGAALWVLAGPTQANMFRVDIQPVQVCNDVGGSCAQVGFFEAETDKIWDQADIDINFFSTVQLDETDFLAINADDTSASGAGPIDEHQALYATGDALLGRNASDTDYIPMYFVDNMPGFFGLGCGAPLFAGFCGGSAGIIIDAGVFSFNGGIGRLDTIAHEIGHVLSAGIPGDQSGVHGGGALNLMETGGSRNVPDAIGQITPDGAMTSQLAADQIGWALDSPFVQTNATVPEPAPLALFALGGLFVAGVGRARRAA